MAKRLRESYIQPMETYMSLKPRSKELLEEVDNILSNDHVLSPFKAKNFPFDCLPISFEEFHSDTGVHELSFSLKYSERKCLGKLY